MITLNLRSRRTVLLFALLVLGAMSLVLATRAEGTTNTRIAGIIRSHVVSVEEGCESPIGVCLAGNFYGSLYGPNEAVGFLFIPQEDGVIFGKSHVVVHDRQGDLFCTSSSSFDLNFADGNGSPFSDLCIITGGTGHWEGAEGWFHTFGNGGPNGNAAEYRGTIRLP